MDNSMMIARGEEGERGGRRGEREDKWWWGSKRTHDADDVLELDT